MTYQPSPNGDLSAPALDELMATPHILVAYRALWSLLRDGDLRLTDALSLDIRDIDFDARTIHVEYPKTSHDPITAPLSDRSASLLREAIGGETAGPALQVYGRPISQRGAIQQARAAGYSIHAFRLAGQQERLRGRGTRRTT